MAESTFIATPYDSLDAETKSIISKNAFYAGLTPEAYYVSRGGISKAGYYGDSYIEGVTLTDPEYFVAIEEARAKGKAGIGIGAAINAAADAKKLAAWTANPDLIPNPYIRMMVKNGSMSVAAALKGDFGGMDLVGTGGAGGRGGAGGDSAALDKARQNAFELMSARFNEYGLGALIPVMKQLIWEDVSEDTMWLRLQETDTFKQRFSANEARRKAGLRVLSVADYVAWEDAYRQVIRSYGLKQFDNDDYVNKFLANDVSITELTNRVTLATKRLKDMPSVVKELKTFYGGVLADSDILGYVLDPKNELQRIERMVAASEIGAAAQEQGLQVGGAMTSEAERMAAEDLAAYGVTQEVARQGYSTIADILPTSEKLSDIYGTRLDRYGQKEAEQEVFKGTASAKRARQKLIATELGTFSGGAGTARGAFATETTL